MIYLSGDVSVIAGTGEKGFDDGLGSSAKFNSPVAIALNKRDKCIYVSDQGNFSIRRISLEDGNTPFQFLSMVEAP